MSVAPCFAIRITRLVFVSISLLGLFAMSGCLPPPGEETAADVQQPPKAPAEEVVQALPGVGKQGQIVGDGRGYLTTVAATLFKTKQRVVFDIQIPQAMQLYQAEHEHYPKTGEEFFSVIIDFNNIALPELPEGHTYVYDPEQGQLMVRRPVE